MLYSGRPDDGPEKMKWNCALPKIIFSGKEIIINDCEGTFSNMGTLIRSGRSILPERELTKIMLQSGSAEETVSWFNHNYSMKDMGRRAERNHRNKLIMGKSYKINYLNGLTDKTYRIIDF